jgi:mRNA interferase HicA
MKRRDLIRYLEQHECVKEREGAKHTIDRNPASGQVAPVPRHREVKEGLARKICKELGIPQPE